RRQGGGRRARGDSQAERGAREPRPADGFCGRLQRGQIHLAPARGEHGSVIGLEVPVARRPLREVVGEGRRGLEQEAGEGERPGRQGGGRGGEGTGGAGGGVRPRRG